MSKTTKVKPKSEPKLHPAFEKEVTQVKVFLQGKDESFEHYELRINTFLRNLPFQPRFEQRSSVFVFPSASSTGRLCSIINYRMITKITDKNL